MTGNIKNNFTSKTWEVVLETKQNYNPELLDNHWKKNPTTKKNSKWDCRQTAPPAGQSWLLHCSRAGIKTNDDRDVFVVDKAQTQLHRHRHTATHNPNAHVHTLGAHSKSLIGRMKNKKKTKHKIMWTESTLSIKHRQSWPTIRRRIQVSFLKTPLADGKVSNIEPLTIKRWADLSKKKLHSVNWPAGTA